jgi:hypothetical protein
MGFSLRKGVKRGWDMFYLYARFDVGDGQRIHFSMIFGL